MQNRTTRILIVSAIPGNKKARLLNWHQSNYLSSSAKGVSLPFPSPSKMPNAVWVAWPIQKKPTGTKYPTVTKSCTGRVPQQYVGTAPQRPLPTAQKLPIFSSQHGAQHRRSLRQSSAKHSAKRSAKRRMCPSYSSTLKLPQLFKQGALHGCQGALAAITGTNRIQSVLFGMQNRKLGPYLAQKHLGHTIFPGAPNPGTGYHGCHACCVSTPHFWNQGPMHSCRA
jgi:hypothetical protein